MTDRPARMNENLMKTAGRLCESAPTGVLLTESMFEHDDHDKTRFSEERPDSAASVCLRHAQGHGCDSEATVADSGSGFYFLEDRTPAPFRMD
jgi:hypothetical protein